MLVISSIWCHCHIPPFVCRVLGGLWLVAQLRPASGGVLSLQDLGVTKVGHVKRILCGIKELGRGAPAAET